MINPVINNPFEKKKAVLGNNHVVRPCKTAKNRS